PLRSPRRRLQPHQVAHVDRATADTGALPPPQGEGGERLERGHVARPRHDNIWILGTSACPFPDPGAHRAVAHRLVDVEPLPFRLLAGDDDVDAVAAAQTVVRN